MGHRLTRLYTRTGDQGSTGLGDGSRIAKDHPRIEAIGAVDELNSVLGLVLAHRLPEDLSEVLEAIQHRLFDIGGELSVPGSQGLERDPVTRLEQELDRLNATLPPLEEFILPAGTETAAHCHLARAVCRRAERRVVALARNETVNPAVIAYLNRLSDLLFVAARIVARLEGGREVYWRSPRVDPGR